jgi:hypothetical protein
MEANSKKIPKMKGPSMGTIPKISGRVVAMP